MDRFVSFRQLPIFSIVEVLVLKTATKKA